MSHIKIINFYSILFRTKMLQFNVWQLAVPHFLPKLLTVDYLKCVLLNCLAGIESGHNKESDVTLSLKILTVMIRAHDGRVECCLNWKIYEIGVNLSLIHI